LTMQFLSKQAKERMGFGVLGAWTLMAVAPVLLIIGYLIYLGAPALSWEFLTQPPKHFLTEGGIFPAIVGTLCLTLGTVVVALPLGIGTAIYLVEYSSESLFKRLVRLAIVNLAGVPSVVYGLFGLGLFALTLNLGRSLVSGALTLGFLTLPVIIATAEEALLSVPDEYRHASLALGATKWQTIKNVVLPTAAPSILTGTILGIGRAAGETAPIMFTAAVFYTPSLPDSIFDQVMALPFHVFVVATQAPNVPTSMAFGAAVVLVALVGGLNAIAVGIRAWMRLRR